MPATLDRIPARLSRSAAGAARLPEWRSPLFGGSQQTSSGVLAGDPSGEGERVGTAGGGQAAGALVEPEVARTRGARREILRYLGGAMNAPAPLLASTLAAMAAAVTACGAVHEACPVEKFVVDRANRVVTTPAYMYDASLRGVAEGIERCVAEVLALVARR